MHRLSFRKAAWATIGLGLVAALVLATIALFGGERAAADNPQPPLPLNQTVYQGLYDASCGTLATTNIETPATPPDSKLATDKNNLYTGEDFDGMDDTIDIAVWANADEDPKENTLDVSGQRIVINGDAVSRSHLKISASDTIFFHATEYGEAGPSGKEAFDMSGQDNCFNLEPDQVVRNSPTAPDGFPFEDQFDPDGDGNILAHFLPGGSFGFTVTSANYFRCTSSPAVDTIPDPLTCDTSSGEISGAPQGAAPPMGVYVASGRFLVNASDIMWTVTAVSGDILDVSGSSQAMFFPFHKNLLFASQWDQSFNSGQGTANTDLAEDALKTGGSSSLYTGITVATNGRNIASGSQNSWTCPIMGDRVTLNGSLLYVSGSECGGPDVEIEKTPDGEVTVNAGENASFTITVTNNGTLDALAVTLTDTLPGTGWTENPDNALCTITADTNDLLECAIGTLASDGGSFSVTVERATTTADCGGDPDPVILDNGSLEEGMAGDAVADGENIGPVSDPGHLFVRCPDVRVEKTPDGEGTPPGTINAGDDAVFTITVTNDGPGQSDSVTLSDNLPDTGLNWSFETGFDEGDCTITGSVGSQLLSCDFGTLADGATRIVKISSPTDADDCGTIPNTVTITADGDIDAGNNSDTGSIVVECGAILIEKRSTKGTNPFVSTTGAVFSVAGPSNFNVTDDNTAGPPDESATVGLVCVSGLEPGNYTVNETSPPPGYGAASEINVPVVATAGTNCSGNLPTGSGIATFTNAPLYDLQVNFRDGGSGETSATINCVGVEPPDSTASPVGWQTTETYLDESAPQIVVCTIDVDP